MKHSSEVFFTRASNFVIEHKTILTMMFGGCAGVIGIAKWTSDYKLKAKEVHHTEIHYLSAQKFFDGAVKFFENQKDYNAKECVESLQLQAQKLNLELYPCTENRYLRVKNTEDNETLICFKGFDGDGRTPIVEIFDERQFSGDEENKESNEGE